MDIRIEGSKVQVIYSEDKFARNITKYYLM